MITYVIKSNVLNLHKIGRTKNFEARVKSLANKIKDKNLQVIKTYDGDSEKYLHNMFSHKRVRGEWFDLNESDLSYLLSSKPETVKTIYGKYHKLISDYKTRVKIAIDLDISERTVLNWAKNNSIKLKSKAYAPIISKHLKE